MTALNPPISLTSPGQAKSDRRSIEPWVIVFLMTYFLPGSLAFPVGTLLIRPDQVIGMVLVPMLILGKRVRWAWPDALMIAVLFIHFTAIIISTGVERAIENTGRDFLILGMPYIVGRYVAQDLERFWRVTRIMVNVLSVLAIGVVIESLTSFNIHRAFWSAFVEMPTPFPRLRFGLERAMGWTTHPIMLGLTYAIFLSITAYSAWTQNGRLGRWAWVKAIAMGAGVFFSLSSGTLVAGGIILGLLLWERFGPRSNATKWTIAFVGAPMAYLWLELASGRALMKILMMKLHLTSPMAWHYRWELYGRVGSVMPGHYLLGFGESYPPEFTGWQSSVDNNYLVVLLSEGWIGLSVWILFMLAALLFAGRYVWIGRDSEVSRTTRVVRLTILGVAAAQFAVALFSTAAAAFWLTLGLSVGLGQLTRDGKVRLPRRPRRRRQPPAPNGGDPSANKQPPQSPPRRAQPNRRQPA